MLHGDTLFASDGALIFLTFIPFIIKIMLLIIGIYFVLKVLKFMKVKIKLDQERNEKIEELLKVISEDKR
ncbi:hypothetical protein [Bacillus sp. EAC]|uniref:hypothetical protein n=1 Tax=Bacillus sp. EAC TaxID=1978338 RepID=UPI000B454FCF|nr:hypothetical protein [Bacillus sp. EAC]